MGLDLARQMRGQRTPRGLGYRWERRRRTGCWFGLRRSWRTIRLQLFQLQLQLFDLVCDLLRLAPELHPPQLGQQQLQVRDLLLTREQLLILDL